MQKPNIPTVFIIFGATGDLMSRKIVPSLYHLYNKNKLPRLLKIIGVARRDLTQEQFENHIRHILQKQKNTDQESIDKFISYFTYYQGQFENKGDYDKLAKQLGFIDNAWKACANKLFYLAVPPTLYKTIFEHLSTSGLTIPCSPEEGWTRLLVEKPFGKDLTTAENLDALLGKLFKEEQIYRIDHYLAKEMLQNILAFRFSNNLLEGIWNNRHIEKIEIKILEKEGVETRGEFYDGLGALRDIGQNHILQMLSLVVMDNPGKITSESVRTKRAEVLESLEKFSDEKVKERTFRAQYEGFRKIEGVNSQSKTETYFKIKTYLTSPRWQGVPIFLEGGKSLSENRKEIAVWFSHPSSCLCPPRMHYRNKITFSLEPKETISIRFWSKEPGLEMKISESMFRFDYKTRRKNHIYADEYEKLLTDAIEGNQILYVSTREIRAMWQFIDPIVYGWNENQTPLQFYEPRSDKIRLTFFDQENALSFKEEIGIIGLGKMGGATALRLIEKGWKAVGYNRTPDDTKVLEKDGLIGAYSLEELVSKLNTPRVVYLMLTAGASIDEILFGNKGLASLLSKGDIIIDAGNSYYKDSIARSHKLAARGIKFIDVGTSGGPEGARSGASLMVGGDRATYDYLLPLYLDLAITEGVQFFEGAGAGHFVKMVHNGIEYGMMQAISEGFTILKNSSYKLDLKEIAAVYNNGSVIESRLIGWLNEAFKLHGQDLKDISGTVAHTGEGEWTVQEAKKIGFKAKVIEEALEFRKQSEKNPSYTGKILSALRAQFGGHKE